MEQPPVTSSTPVPVDVDMLQLKEMNQVATQPLPQDILRSLVVASGSVLPVPQAMGHLDLAPLMNATLSTSQTDSFGLFDGSDWLVGDDSVAGLNELQQFLTMSAQTSGGPASNMTDDCVDLEPVPISPLLDLQRQAVSCLSVDAYDVFLPNAY